MKIKYWVNLWSNETQRKIKRFRTKFGLMLWIRYITKRIMSQYTIEVRAKDENGKVIFEDDNFTY